MSLPRIHVVDMTRDPPRLTDGEWIKSWRAADRAMRIAKRRKKQAYAIVLIFIGAALPTLIYLAMEAFGALPGWLR